MSEAFVQLTRIQGARKLKGSQYHLNAYEWPGAGSEKGGSAEAIVYNDIVMLPQEESMLVIGLGDKKWFHNDNIGVCFGLDARNSYLLGDYSVLTRTHIHTDLATTLLEFHQEHIHEKDRPEMRDFYSEFARWEGAIEKVLEGATRGFSQTLLFAFDDHYRDGKNKGFYFVPAGYWGSSATRLKKSTKGFLAKDVSFSLHDRNTLAEKIAQYAAGTLEEGVGDLDLRVSNSSRFFRDNKDEHLTKKVLDTLYRKRPPQQLKLHLA